MKNLLPKQNGAAKKLGATKICNLANFPRLRNFATSGNFAIRTLRIFFFVEYIFLNI